MVNTDIDLEPLRMAIRKYKMMEAWKDSLRDEMPEESKIRANNRALKAKDTYLRIMSSTKNDGSENYQEWAIYKALGLRVPKKIGEKNNLLLLSLAVTVGRGMEVMTKIVVIIRIGRILLITSTQIIGKAI